MLGTKCSEIRLRSNKNFVRGKLHGQVVNSEFRIHTAEPQSDLSISELSHTLTIHSPPSHSISPEHSAPSDRNITESTTESFTKSSNACQPLSLPVDLIDFTHSLIEQKIVRLHEAIGIYIYI